MSVNTPSWVGEVEGIRSGDPRSAAEIVRRFTPLARATARRLVAAADVDDVVQDALVEALASIGQLRAAEAFPAWLRLTVRKHADRARRSTRPAAPLPEDHAMASTEAAPDVVVERLDLAAAVRVALESLSDPDRRLLELRYLAGWSIAELAEITDTRPGTVRKRLHDARRRLRPAVSHLKEITMTDYTTFLGRSHPAGTDIPSAVSPMRPQRLDRAETGLKILDTVAPVARGGSIELAGPTRTGQLVVLVELAYRLTRGETETAIVAAGVTADVPGAFPIFSGLIDGVDEHDRHAVFLSDDVAGAHNVLAAATSLAYGLAAQGTDVLLALDQATREATATDPVTLGGLTPSGGSVTVVLFNVVGRAEALPEPAGCDTRLVFSVEHLLLGLFPAIDPIVSRAEFTEPRTAAQIRRVLEQAAEIRAFFHQPMKIAEPYTGEPSTWVNLDDADAELRRLLTK